MKVSNEAYARIGRELLLVAQNKTIPYVAGGMTFEGMDCQGLCEYLLIACGLPAAELNLKGSNAHWRSCVWRGTPEECVAAFGCVPVGAWVFIVDDGGGEVARGYTDGLGDANHMGVYLGDGVAMHASASRGCVAESVFREKTIPNGGWNAVGLSMWVDFGENVESVVAGGAGDSDSDCVSELTAGGVLSAVDGSAGLTAGGSGAVRYATVTSPDGNPVKLRKTASKHEGVYWLVSHGARVRVERERGDWSLITALCADGYIRRAYMMSAYLAA